MRYIDRVCNEFSLEELIGLLDIKGIDLLNAFPNAFRKRDFVEAFQDVIKTNNKINRVLNG